MIHRGKLLSDLKPRVEDLESDLRARFATRPDYRERLTADWQSAREAGRTAEALETWAESQYTQSAVAWVLAAVFVRFCEDNGLLDEPLIAGTDSQGRSAVARQEAFYRRQPLASDNDYLRDVFAVAGRMHGLADVFKAQAALLDAPVSPDAAKRLIGFFRATDADTGRPLHDFADPDAWNTRFLGDLYQDLSAAARERYALLQTPEFVEAFILDRTLTSALDSYRLDEVDLIDPTCGSGHFLLGAFERLAPLWLRARPDNTNVALQEALDRIAGIDLNPFAVAIARFRLLIAALRLAGVGQLRLAPDFHLHIETGDSLLHGFDQRDHDRRQTALDLETPRENLATAADHAFRHAFAVENLDATQTILARKYAVVVGNPPYITVKDRAISALYRERYSSCHGKYALVAPFCERFWALAKPLDHTRRAGYVGLIVANSYMKREFGKKLVEAFFPTVDLTHVIDTAGAYIPGHGTPTVILLGRARPPATGQVRAVMGIKGEPATPADPALGIVWQAILDQIDRRDSESEWVSVADVARATLAKHPWSMGGGGAADLLENLNDLETNSLSALSVAIGRTTHTGEDNVFYLPIDYCRRFALENESVPVIEGESVRDYRISSDLLTLFPYDKKSVCVREDLPSKLLNHFWLYRRLLRERKDFGKYIEERGLRWYEHSMFFPERFRTSLSVAYADIATHNHFVLDRGGKVFKQTAPVIKLPAEVTEGEHLGVLGLLNASTACFWLKQVCHNKGSTVDQQGARQRTAAFEDFYAFNATKVGQFPVTDQRPVALARTLDQLAQQHATLRPAALFARAVPTRAELDAARAAAESIRNRMIAWQEELDWQVYQYYGVWDEDLCHPGEPPEVRVGERAFEIVLAQDCAAGKATTTWFERHGAERVTAVPDHWPADYRARVEQRMAAIRRSRDLALIERPECNRRWSRADWDAQERAALENWLLDRLEADDLWPRDAEPAPALRSVRELGDALADDAEFRRALDLYAGSGGDTHATLAALAMQASAPYLDALRYSDSGRRKRAVWQAVWQAQRREDAIDADVARQCAGQPPDAIAAEQKRRKAAEVGDIPVPPKYKPEDFREGTFWKLRGPLDVPKERFVSFPGLERPGDPGSPMLLWAGYETKGRALALAGRVYDIHRSEGSDPVRLAPALAGLDEWLPWVHQWHPEIDPDLGMTSGDYLQGLLDAQLAQLGLALADVRAWAPPSTPRRRRRG